MSTVNGATPPTVADLYTLPETTVKHNQNLGKDEFLALLIAQMQNQDPTEPMDNSQMIAQMVQFSNLEAMTNMNSTMQTNQTYSLIGKGIVGLYVHPETGEKTEITGIVDSAGTEGGESYVMIGDMKIKGSNISQVYDANVLTGETEIIAAATSMVGKYARADIGTSQSPNYIEGLVSRWHIQNGEMTVTIGGTDVALTQLVGVADDAESLGPVPGAQGNE